MRYKSIYWSLKKIILSSVIMFNSCMVFSQNDSTSMHSYIKNFDFNERILPKIPDKTKKIRVIIDTDAKNEIDDQWALTLALLSNERFEIVGFVASNFDHRHDDASSGIEKSFEEIKLVLNKMGLEDKYPVFRGSHPMRYKYEPSESEGVDFIIKKAMESSESDPIWVIALGSATNLASAYLKNPQIQNRVVFFWHGRTKWPEKLWNFNVFGDRLAAVTLFHAPIPFVLFDTGTYLTCSMEESEEKVLPYGEIGKYLHEYRYTTPWYMQSDKGFFDLGDIAALVDPEIAYWQEVSCPEVDPDMSYKFKGTKGKILRCYFIDRDKTFKLLYDELKSNYEH